MDKSINNNGYDYVDLGLPSGTKWATMNVGASKPSDAGLYLQWGDTQGYTAAQVGTGEGQKKFASDYSDYKWNASEGFSKYNTAGAALELEDDAAHAYMGGSWHMPTPTQISELLNTAYVTNEWTTQDGVNGRLFTSKNNGKSMFFPAAGHALGGSVQNSGGYGLVWSSLLNTDNANYGQLLYFNSGSANLYYYYRCYGFSVRGVIDKSNDNSRNKKNDMNEKLNLVEILKNAPAGTKLWSPIIGECEFVEIVKDYPSPIRCKALDNIFWGFYSDGRYANYEGAQCVLFPSKENKDWLSFKIPCKHKHFEPLQKVLVKFRPYYSTNNIWEIDFYSHYDNYLNKHTVLSYGYCTDDNILPYEGNEDKLGKIVEN